MTTMRKVLLFVVAVAMLVGGLYWLAFELLVATRIHFLFVIASAMLMTLGAYLLWDDFMAPLFGIRRSDGG
jgi:hypothetical protein